MVESNQVEVDEDGYVFDPNRYYEFTEEMRQHAERILSQESESSFQPMIQKRLEIDAAKNWDIFYRQNTTHFYKDRHYLLREFNELETALQRCSDEELPTLLDCGCGVGNAFWPMIEKYPNRLKIQCFDFSKKAIQFVKEN